ncbi:MAG: hypothetical protein R3B99_34495 [Polyangiales bacterium]
MGLVRPFGVALGMAILLASRAHADDPVVRSVEVEAQLQDDTLRGVVRFEVTSDGDPLRVWLYSDRNAVEPSAMDQRSSRWIFPRERDLAPTRVRVSVDGVAREVEPQHGAVGGARPLTSRARTSTCRSPPALTTSRSTSLTGFPSASGGSVASATV